MSEVYEGKSSVPEEDVDSLLEGGLRERPILVAVDAVAGDGHEVAAAGHAVDQSRQVAVVDVRAVELDHAADLPHQRIARRLQQRYNCMCEDDTSSERLI